jgi:hypothetical protein
VHDVFFYPTAGLDRALGLADVEAPKFSEQSGNEGGRVISPKHMRNLANDIRRGGGTDSTMGIRSF